MGCTACTEPQCLYKGALYLLLGLLDPEDNHTSVLSEVWNCVCQDNSRTF